MGALVHCEEAQLGRMLVSLQDDCCKYLFPMGLKKPQIYMYPASEIHWSGQVSMFEQ